MFQIKRIWPKQNEPLCTRQTRPCTHGTCVHIEKKSWQNNCLQHKQDKAYITYFTIIEKSQNISAKHNKSAKLTQNMSVGNNNIFSRIFQHTDLLSCFSTMMSTLHDGSFVRQELTQFKGGNSGVPIYLVI